MRPGPARPPSAAGKVGGTWRRRRSGRSAQPGRAGSWIGVPLAPPDRPCPSHSCSSLGPAASPAPLSPRRSLVGPQPTLAQSGCSLWSTRRSPCPSPSPNLLGPGSLTPVGAGVTIPALSARSDVARLLTRHPGTVQLYSGEGPHSAIGEPKPWRGGGGGGLGSEPGGCSPPLPHLGPVLIVIPWGRGAEPPCPNLPLRTQVPPFHPVKSAGHLLAAQGGAPCRCSPSKTDRQPLASKPDSCRHQLCDLGAGKPLRASVSKAVKWGYNENVCLVEGTPQGRLSTGRDPGGLSSRLGEIKPGLRPQQRLRCEPSSLLRAHLGALAWMQLGLPLSLSIGLGAGKKALTRSKISAALGAGAFEGCRARGDIKVAFPSLLSLWGCLR